MEAKKKNYRKKEETEADEMKKGTVYVVEVAEVTQMETEKKRKH